MMFGASAGKMYILVSSGASSFTYLAGVWLGQGLQIGYWPRHKHMVSRHVVFGLIQVSSQHSSGVPRESLKRAEQMCITLL